MLKKGKRVVAVCLAMLMMFSVMPVDTVFAKELKGTIDSQNDAQTDVQQLEKEIGAINETPAVNELPGTDEASVDSEVPTEEQAVAAAKGKESKLLLNFLIVNAPYVQIPGEQEITVSLGDGTQQVDSAVLNMTKKETGESVSMQASTIQDDMVVFSKQYTEEAEKGSYQLESITYTYQGKDDTIQLAQAGLSAQYGVGVEVSTNPDGYLADGKDQPEDGIEVVTYGEDGQTQAAGSISDAISNASEEVAGVFDTKTRNASGNVVVVLDPGHDNTHSGAAGNGAHEEDLNLKIALYCKAELETYGGVTVYMTRDAQGNCPSPGTNSTECNANRVAFAQSVGANVYVSIHLNSFTNSNPHGAEVYYPSYNYNSTVGQQGKDLAQIICEKLVALGLADRGIQVHNSKDGTTYPDGSEADYYGVIRRSKLAGFPAIIIEHAFINNPDDFNNFLSDDSKLQLLGATDAAGIAQYFGLQKGAPTLKGICYNYNKNGIDVGVDYVSSTPVQFRWLSYNLDTQQWEEISSWYNGNWATWQAKKGNYWLQVQATNASGQVSSYTISFRADKNYSNTAVNLNGICYLYKPDGIDIGVAYDAVDPNVNFRWLSYNLETQEWREISNWYGGNWATWKPEAGSYWLQAQARNSKGEVLDTYTINFYTPKSYYQPPISMEGICYIYQDTGIDVGVAYKSTSKNVKFRWQAYNLDTKTWEGISDWYNGNWATWKPKPGNYFLHVEAKTANGDTTSSTINFANSKDYTKHTLSLGGISVVDNGLTIDVGVNYTSSDPKVKFKWQILDLSTQGWTSLTDWTHSNWASWKPSDGQYWIHVEAVTTDGVTAVYTLGYAVSARYNIMGSTTTTLSQMVKYYKANNKYPSFYSNSDAPTVEAFCQMYLDECAAEGVKADVAFCQAMKETGFLKYPGTVKIEQFNFAGIGATDSGDTPNSFSSVREGIRAQVQHLKAYASYEPLNNPCVDPRFKYVTRGTAPYVEWLGINENPYGKGWASDKNYGYNIKDRIIKLLSY